MCHTSGVILQSSLFSLINETFSSVQPTAEYLITSRDRYRSTINYYEYGSVAYVNSFGQPQWRSGHKLSSQAMESMPEASLNETL
jgi:hypothetical protein